MEIWGKKTFCLITGASRGIGRCIALKFSQKLGAGSVMCLLARNEEKLEETKLEIEKLCPGQISVSTTPVDLGIAEFGDFTEIIGKCCPNPGDFEEALIVHNAASTGQVDTKTADYSDTQFLIKYYRENLISVITLNSAFFKHFRNTSSKVLKVVVNITSIFGIEPGQFMGHYCTGKAAREMMFRVVALEEPDAIVLGYSPGPVETDMLNGLRHSGEPHVRNWMLELDAEGKVLTCDATVSILINVLQERKFKSGEHIEYNKYQ